MNKQKRFFLAFLIILVTSCDNSFDIHIHSFSNKWSSDEIYHWHSATCEHTNEVADKAKHDWDVGKVTLEPTEETVGAKTFTCNVCKRTKTESINKLVHTHKFSDEWTSDETYHWHSATCEHTNEVADKAEHDWDVGKVTLEPTEETDGAKTFTCKVCKRTKTESINKLPHTHKFSNKWTSDEIYHWHSATCEHTEEISEKAEHDWDSGIVTLEPTKTTDGEKKFVCTVCGITKKEIIHATGSLGLKFVKMANGEYQLSGIGTCEDEYIIIPEYYNNAKVTKISSYAFYNCNTIKSVTISDSVNCIESSSFLRCEHLETVIMKNSVEKLGARCFEDCIRLKSVTLSDSIKSIEANTFANCSRLETVNLPASLENIGNAAFCFCENLHPVTIPKKVIKIGNSAFGSCKLLNNILIPKSVIYIGTYAFSSPINVNFEEENNWYATSNQADAEDRIGGLSINLENNGYINNNYFKNYLYK